MADNNGKSPLRQVIRPGLTFVQVLDYKTARELYKADLLFWLCGSGPCRAYPMWPLTFGTTDRPDCFLRESAYVFGILEED